MPFETHDAEVRTLRWSTPYTTLTRGCVDPASGPHAGEPIRHLEKPAPISMTCEGLGVACRPQ